MYELFASNILSQWNNINGNRSICCNSFYKLQIDDPLLML